MKKHYNSRILVFGDLHMPYHDKQTLEFLAEIKKDFRPDHVVCTGDIVDFYASSRFPKDPDHPDSLVNEIKKIRKSIRKLGRVFPKLDLCMGNHDDRMAIRATGAGIPSSLMMSFGDIIGAPEGWNIIKSTDDFNLVVNSTKETITFAHNRGVNTYLIAQRLGRTFVAGHQHTKCQNVGYNNGIRTFFGCNTPCLISDKGSPFAYGKISNINPIKGCLLIEEGVPRSILM